MPPESKLCGGALVAHSIGMSQQAKGNCLTNKLQHESKLRPAAIYQKNLPVQVFSTHDHVVSAI